MKDLISRKAVKEQMIKYGFHAPDMTVTEFVEDILPVYSQNAEKWIKRSKVKKMIAEIKKKPLNDESMVWVIDVVDIIEKYLKENEE